jgi:1-deoxy-D-xylulose-5-phosphate reductoisomerase
MGPKISTDCATLLNKGLEAIEAYYLFKVDKSKIDVLVHYESIIHGMVHYADGATLAHLSLPDMRSPISYALAYPRRIPIEHKELNLAQIGAMNFSAPDYNRFPLLKLSFDALNSGLAAQIVLNTSNEVAVNSFLNNKIKFLDISKTVEKGLNNFTLPMLSSISDILEFNQEVIDKVSESV